MAVFDITNTLTRIMTYVVDNGHVQGGVQLGAYTSPPDTQEGPVAFLLIRDTDIVEVSAQGNPTARHIIVISVMINALQEPTGEAELTLAAAAENIQVGIIGEYDMGASIRSIDVGGIYGVSMSTAYGTLFINNTGFRVVDIILPFIVDWTESAAP